jgi:hypothetical protein
MKRIALYLSGPVVVALLVPLAFGVAGLKLYPMLVVASIPVVLAFTLLVAAPLFVFAGRRFPIRAATFVGLAFAAGFLSFLVFTYLSTPTYSSVDEVVHVQDGQLTLPGWRGALMQSVAVGLLSIPGGLLWWLAARIPLERSPRGA